MGPVVPPFRASLDALSLRSDVIGSIKIIPPPIVVRGVHTEWARTLGMRRARPRGKGAFECFRRKADEQEQEQKGEEEEGEDKKKKKRGKP